jgi:hypothetical protein
MMHAMVSDNIYTCANSISGHPAFFLGLLRIRYVPSTIFKSFCLIKQEQQGFLNIEKIDGVAQVLPYDRNSGATRMPLWRFDCKSYTPIR